MIKTKLFRARIWIAGFLVVQVLFGYSSFVQVNIVAAEPIIPDAIKSDENASKAINVPKYEGVDQSIKDYLCVPDENNLGTALYDCIGKIYRFGIAFGGIALVFFIVFAGYLYMSGGEGSKEKGKTIFTTALTGMAIILSSYVLLNFINPSLTKIRPIQAPIFSASSLPKCVDVGFGENCVLPNGQATGPSIGGGGIGSGKCESETGANGLVCKIGCAPKAGVKCENKYNAAIAAASAKYNVDQNAIKGMIQAESTWNEGSTSHAAAKGIMQILDGTWKDTKCTGDPYKAEDSINCGTKYMRHVYDVLKGYGTEEKVRWMAAAYNSGPNLRKPYSKSTICPGKLNYECPFSTSGKTTCVLTHPAESINHGYRVEEYARQYSSGACK